MASEWQRYRLSWRIGSPLHIGYRTIGTIMRTRLWVPGRNIWGALIEALAQAKGATPQAFEDMRKLLDEHFRFEAWFLGPDAGTFWPPRYTERGLCYDAVPERTMQWLSLGANVSTAIEHGSNVAEEGNLFEVEYIAPHWLHDHEHSHVERGKPIWLVGHLWARNEGGVRFSDDDINVDGLSLQTHARTLSIGGERAKGYGRLACLSIQHCADTPSSPEADPQLQRKEGESFPLLVRWQREQVKLRGQVEPIVGRTTKETTRHGHYIEPAEFCWLPGSVGDDIDLTLRLVEKLPGIAVIA